MVPTWGTRYDVILPSACKKASVAERAKGGGVELGTDRAKNKAKIAGPTMRTLGITLLLNVSSTTEPIRCRIGSVVELRFNIPI
jgi:hypothetical protein